MEYIEKNGKFSSFRFACLTRKMGMRPEVFLDATQKVLDLKNTDKTLDIICNAADMGRRQFIDKLGWLEDYQQELQVYTQMVDIAQ